MTITPLTIKDIENAKDLADDNSNAVAHFFYVYADLDSDGTSTTKEITDMFESLNSTYGGETLAASAELRHNDGYECTGSAHLSSPAWPVRGGSGESPCPC